MKLVYVQGGFVRECRISRRPVRIGRDPECEISSMDPTVSRRHVTVEWGRDGVVARDEGSANGLWVNGVRLQEAVLTHGDVLCAGKLKIVLQVEPDDRMNRSA